MVDVQSVFYPHSCLIRRTTGNVDPITHEELFDVLYAGKCGLQYSSNGNTSLQGYTYQTFPSIIIPETKQLFVTNDEVVVTTENGRVQTFTVETAEVCDLEGLDKLSGTTLWLKLGEDNVR